MTPEQKAAYVIAQAACAVIELQSMIAANNERSQSGLAQAYDEGAFAALENRYTIGHNAVLGLFHE